MSSDNKRAFTRRSVLGTAAAMAASSLAAPVLGQGMTDANTTEMENELSNNIRRNMSSFRSLEWQDYFTDLSKGAILVDIQSRALHFWNSDASIYKLYPTSVPISEELTRRGSTSVTQKVPNPPWHITKQERDHYPDWPESIPGGDPKNPLGKLALYLSWPAYRIHGTHDTRKIGRRSSNGCIGLYNEHITELYDLVQVGTPVLLI